MKRRKTLEEYRPGDRIRYLAYNGRNIDGSTDWKERTGRVVFAIGRNQPHVVANRGNGQPVVITERNHVP